MHGFHVYKYFPSCTVYVVSCTSNPCVCLVLSIAHRTQFCCIATKSQFEFGFFPFVISKTRKNTNTTIRRILVLCPQVIQINIKSLKKRKKQREREWHTSCLPFKGTSITRLPYQNAIFKFWRCHHTLYRMNVMGNADDQIKQEKHQGIKVHKET